jgi:uncharacterized phage protein gp47/JayE
MTIQELKNRIYNDFISSFKNAITPLKKSFFEQLSNALSATFQLVYIYLDRIFNDSFLSTCTDSRVLSYFAPLKNITPKVATSATGTVRFTGIDGTLIHIDTLLIYNELEYMTTADGTIATGYADIACQSVDTGTLNNTLANVDMFLSSPIDGVDNKATSILGFSDAIDDEIVESVRTRTKQKFATASQIDNYNFYRSLANEVPNVKASFISELKNGVGTFGVTILTYSNNGVPIQADIDAVHQYFIDKEAVPVYVDAEFFLPTIVTQNFSIQLAINNTENQSLFEQYIRDYLYLYQKPNYAFEFADLALFLQSKGGRIVSPDPTTNITPALDEIIDLGAITWL